MTDFDKVIQRRGTNCIKWDLNPLKDRADVIPMWVADMDFEAAPGIINAMQKVMDHKIFGYRFNSPEYKQVIIDWFKRRHNFEAAPEWICYLPNVVVGLSLAVQSVSEPGDEIILNTPVYGPFYKAVTDNHRVVKSCPMKENDGYYTMDFEKMTSLVTEKTKAVMLCNPHNPGGRVWTREELTKLADFCIEHQLYIISDDIHADLTLGDHVHTMIASISDEISERCITCTSPSKAFNLAGMQAAHAFIKNESLRERFMKPLNALHLSGGNSFEEALVIGAYRDSEEWLKEAVAYIEGNVDYFVDYIGEHIPQILAVKPEGTYLVWVDCRKLHMHQEQLLKFFIDQCHLFVNSGLDYGPEGEGFVRFNMACSRKLVEKAVRQMEDGFKTLN